MSTRSIIGTTTGTSFEAAYCHYDGYPTHQLPILAGLITRHGQRALDVLTGHTGAAPYGPIAAWASIGLDTPAYDVELPYESSSDYYANTAREDRDPGLCTVYPHLSSVPTTERGEVRNLIAEGFGIGINSGRRFTESDNLGMCEWAYLVTEDLTLIVSEIHESSQLVEVARFTREELAALAGGDAEQATRVQHAECAEDFSRCSHMAWVHEEVPEEARRLSMQEWIGTTPLRVSSAIAAVVAGKRYDFTGSGSLRRGKWEVGVKGSSTMLPVFSQDRSNNRAPLPGVELIYPTTKAELVS